MNELPVSGVGFVPVLDIALSMNLVADAADGFSKPTLSIWCGVFIVVWDIVLKLAVSC